MVFKFNLPFEEEFRLTLAEFLTIITRSKFIRYIQDIFSEIKDDIYDEIDEEMFKISPNSTADYCFDF